MDWAIVSVATAAPFVRVLCASGTVASWDLYEHQGGGIGDGRMLVKMRKVPGGQEVYNVLCSVCAGNLAKQAVQRFSSFEDLDKQNVTIEEREEYEQHISGGTVVYAGVDYEAILRQVGSVIPLEGFQGFAG